MARQARPLNGVVDGGASRALGAAGLALACLARPRRRPGPISGPASSASRPCVPWPSCRLEALAASPPLEAGPFRPVDLVELTSLDPTIRLDIRYATADNFLSTPVYDEARAFLQRPAAEALLRAHRALADTGHGLLVHDAYRPWWVTKVFWEATPKGQA